jgi:nitrogen fixation/metabolism regulation signal transduction histidine kinase
LSQIFEINLDNKVEVLVESKMFSHVIYLVSINAYEAIYKKIDSDKRFEPKLFWEVTGDRTLSCIDNGDGFEGVNFEDACRPFVTSKFGKEGRGLGLFTITYLCDKLGIEISYKRMGELTFIDLTFPNSFIYRLESKKDVA